MSLSKKQLAEFAGAQVLKAVEELIVDGRGHPWHVDFTITGIETFNVKILVSLEHLTIKEMEKQAEDELSPI